LELEATTTAQFLLPPDYPLLHIPAVQTTILRRLAMTIEEPLQAGLGTEPTLLVEELELLLSELEIIDSG
jgi:hypothetical protein